MKIQVSLDPRILSCPENALSVMGEGSIGVCARHVNAFGEEFDTIIYDSTDQIILEPSKRSEKWNVATRSLQQKVPFGILGFSGHKLAGHYYHVIFSDAYKPDSYLF